MADWMLYTIIGAATLLVGLLIFLIVRGKVVPGEIEIGWPPKIKLVPKDGSSSQNGGKDEIIAENKAQVEDFEFDGAATNFSARANNAKISKVKVKRKQ